MQIKATHREQNLETPYRFWLCSFYLYCTYSHIIILHHILFSRTTFLIPTKENCALGISYLNHAKSSYRIAYKVNRVRTFFWNKIEILTMNSKIFQTFQNDRTFSKNFSLCMQLIESNNIFSWSTLSTVVQHLLNLSFWVTSLQANNESLFIGNLTTNHPLSLNMENFAELIDNGPPSPSESGLTTIANMQYLIQHTNKIRIFDINLSIFTLKMIWFDYIFRWVFSWTFEFHSMHCKWSMSKNYVIG